MRRFVLVLLIFIGVSQVLLGCAQTKTVTNGNEEALPTETAESGQGAVGTIDSEPSTPLQWIYFKGEKYELNRVVPVQEIDRDQLLPTGITTGEGDGFLPGREIFLYELDGSIFAVDDTGPTEEWVNFVR